MSPTTVTTAAAVSGVANVVMVGLLIIDGAVIWRQRRRFARQAEGAIDVANELSDTMAENDRLQVENDRLHGERNKLAAKLEELRDENRRLLRSMVTGEAS